MRVKNKRDFERLIRRWDGEDGGGSAASGAAAAAGDTTATATTASGESTATTTTGTETQTTQPFKSFASEADYKKDIDFRIQQALKTHEEKLKGKLTPEIRKQLEAEANMTAEQKVQAQLDQIEADKKALAKEKSRIKAEGIFASKGIAEEDRASLLDSIVSDDAEETEKRANALIAVIEKAANEKVKVAMKSVKTPASTTETTDKDTPAVSFAKSLAEKRAATAKTSNETLSFYLNGGNKK